MRITASRAYTRPTPVPKMPAGLVELMEGLTKEVLKSNTTNVYEFCAAHMERLLEIRDGPTVKRVLNLDERILKAQNKVKLRAQKRRQNYDRELQLLCDKNEKLELKNASLKGPVSHDTFLNNVEEIEISQKPVSILDSAENVKDIEIKTQKITLDDGTPKVDDDCTNNNELKNNDNLLVVGDPMLEQKSDVPRQMVIGEPNCDIKENFKDCNGTMITKDFMDGPKNDVMKETESVTVEKQEKESIIENTPMIIQETDQELKKESLNNDDESDEVNDKKQDIQNETEEKTLINSNNDDHLYNLVNMDSKLKDNINSNNDKLEETNVIIGNDNANYSENIKNSAETNLNHSHIKEDVESSLDKTQNSQDLIKEEEKTENTISADNDQLEKKTQDLILLTSRKSTSPASSFEKDIINVNSQDTKGNNESETHTQLYKSELRNNMPLILDDVFENSSDTVSNDNRATSNMDLETAAITIQKVFRSFLFKSRASNDEANSIDEDSKEANGYTSPNMNKERRPLGVNRMDTILQTVNEEKSLSLSTDDSSTLSSAATIIQAHIRGFLVRNKLNSNKTVSTNSLLNSDDPVTASLEIDSNQNQSNSKTILNIHIVPEGEVHLSRDESIITSMDLSLDGSPPSSINLHPLGYDKSEPRKQLKREDAIQSISPPSNNSGKLSEDVDSTKELLINDVTSEHNSNGNLSQSDQTHIPISTNTQFIQNNHNPLTNIEEDGTEESKAVKQTKNSLTKMNSDEMDVVTPFTQDENQHVPDASNSKLIHSGEMHDVLPTNVSRSSTSVVREFKAVLVYFLLWNK